jgi:hypothetical protein
MRQSGMEQPRLTRAMIAIDVVMAPKHRQRAPPLWSRNAWLFTLNNLRASDEVEACAKFLAQEHHGRIKRLDSADGTPIYWISGAQFDCGPGSSIDPLCGAAVAFAALHHWGCGPHQGSRSTGSLEAWSAESLSSLLEAWSLSDALDPMFYGRAPRARL